MKRLFSTRPFNTDLGILLLRLILGGLFFWHAYDALEHYNQYLGMSIAQNTKGTIGLGAKFEFDLVVYSYLICGVFIVLGFLTRLSVIPIFIAMTVAFFIAHKGQAFMMKELPFTYWLLCVVVFVFGSGSYSLDRLIFKK